MKKIAILGLFALAFSASAAVTVGTAPTSLVTTATTMGINTDKAVFEFALTADDSETLSSVAVTVNSTTAVAGDFTGVSVYRDDGDGSYDSGDAEAGTNATVNIGSTTTVATASNNTLTGGKFFVVLKTSGSWSGTDSATITFNANGITASSNSPTITAVTTAAINAPDITGPTLQSAVAMGDKVVLTFNEATNKAAVTGSNINTVLVLNNSHSWLDGASSIGSATWDDTGKILTVVLSAGTSMPTVAVGDTVTVSGSLIKDSSGNNASGNQVITGNFGTTPGDTDDEEEDDHGKRCENGIINGKLYRTDGPTVYLAAGCKLKPFRGAAVFHARGHKFQDILKLMSLKGIEVSVKPALPAGGTLIKGSDNTVWFVTEKGKRKGFTSEKAFRRLGFNFLAVKVISDSDLQEMGTDSAITENSTHPEGTVLKCTTSSTVYMMKGNKRFAFTNPVPYLERGHTWDAIAVIDCKTFNYQEGTDIAQ